MTDTTGRIAGLLAEQHGCDVEHEDTGRLMTCEKCAHVAAVLAEAGVGFVGEAEVVEVGAYARQKDAASRAASDAARMAQIAARRTRQLEALRERVRALADEWGIAAQDGDFVGDEDFAEALRDSGAWRFARDFRALLLNEEEA